MLFIIVTMNSFITAVFYSHGYFFMVTKGEAWSPVAASLSRKIFGDCQVKIIYILDMVDATSDSQ